MGAIQVPTRVVRAATVVLMIQEPAGAVSEATFPWLLFSMGARASGMGGAQVTEAAGADRLYWNPALLGIQEGIAGTAMYFRPVPDLTDDIRFWYVAGAGGWRRIGGFGLSFMRLEYGEGVYPPGGTEQSASLGYGFAISDRVSGGLAAKIIQSNLGSVITGEILTAWAVDVGVHVRELFRSADAGAFLPNGIRWGLAIQNLGPHVQFVDGGFDNPLPLTFRTGIGCDAYEDEVHRLTLAADMSKVLVRQRGDSGVVFEVDPPLEALFTAWTDESLKDELDDAIYNLGLEYALQEMVFLRTGWVQDRRGGITDHTLGVGARYRGLQFDYASYPQVSGSARENRFSVTADLQGFR